MQTETPYVTPFAKTLNSTGYDVNTMSIELARGTSPLFIMRYLRITAYG